MRKGSLSSLARRRLAALREVQREGARRRVVSRRGLDERRPRLMIPARKRAEIAARRLGEAGDEVLDGGRRPVITVEIEIHAPGESRLADQDFQHADDFGAFLVDRRRVEIIDLVIGLRPHIMGERPGVLGKLGGAQGAHIGDALHRARAHVAREFMVAKDREALFEAELEPVAAGDAVAGPVVKIFMRDDGLDMGVIGVGRGRGRGEDIFVVEDVEALVLHRAHVEVGHGDDIEDVEIIFAAEGGLVPGHRPLEGVHGVGRLRLLAMFDMDAELDLAPGSRDEFVVNGAEIAADEGEQIAGLRERIAARWR